MAVDVKVASVVRAWKETGRNPFWLEVGSKPPDPEPGTAALGLLNERTAIHGGITSALATASPKGLIAFVSGVDDATQLETWLHDLAETLEASGATGTLRGAPWAREPRWYPGFDVGAPGDTWPDPSTLTCPVAFIAWNLELDQAKIAEGWTPDRDWHLSPATTERICDHLAAWVTPGGPTIVAGKGTFNLRITDPAGIAPILTSSALGTAMAATYCYDDHERHLRDVHLGPSDTVAKVLDDHEPWHQHVDDLRSLILELPDLTTQAAIRTGYRTNSSWMDYDTRVPLDGLLEGDLRYNKHLLPDHAADANGIQVLTTSHLDKAHDLTNWTTTDLGHDRHLVEANDLEPWYSQPDPDPDTLTRARRDFGPMLITEQLIIDNPPPWGGPHTRRRPHQP